MAIKSIEDITKEIIQDYEHQKIKICYTQEELDYNDELNLKISVLKLLLATYKDFLERNK